MVNNTHQCLQQKLIRLGCVGNVIVNGSEEFAIFDFVQILLEMVGIRSFFSSYWLNSKVDREP